MREKDISNNLEDRCCGKWERVLWKRQPFPDNFVTKSFFRVHTKCRNIYLIEAFYGSLLVSQELCSCIGLFAIFRSLSDRQLSTSTVFIVTVILSSVGYCSCRIPLLIKNSGHGQTKWTPFLDEIKAALLTVVVGWFSSPVIKTLTASVATDTIHACTIGLFLLHLILHPYGANVAIVNPTMSHNLGLFAAVCLASRLNNDLDVFALVIVAIGLFNLLPSFRFYCQKYFGKAIQLLFSLVTICSCLYGVIMFAESIYSCFLMALLIINVVSPLLFIYLQPYRKNIYGPWDEALIKEKRISL